jgi:hypothetical protein
MWKRRFRDDGPLEYRLRLGVFPRLFFAVPLTVGLVTWGFLLGKTLPTILRNPLERLVEYAALLIPIAVASGFTWVGLVARLRVEWIGFDPVARRVSYEWGYVVCFRRREVGFQGVDAVRLEPPFRTRGRTRHTCYPVTLNIVGEAPITLDHHRPESASEFSSAVASLLGLEVRSVQV